MRRSFTRLILSVFLIGLFFCQQMPLAAFADSGNPFKSMTIPGEILMCDFDMGGEGVAYRKGSPTNGDSDYRAGEIISFRTVSALRLKAVCGPIIR